MAARDTSLPPLPRDIEASQSSPTPLLLSLAGAPQGAPANIPGAPQGQGAGMAAAGAIGDPVSMIEKKLSDLANWASEMAGMLENVLPSAQPLLVPILRAGKAIEEQIAKLRARQSGVIGGGAPRPMAPGEAPENPAEGLPVRPPR